MINPRHFLRMARWARNPPSDARVKLVFGVIAACIALFVIDRFLGWPDFLTLPNTPKGRIN